VFVAEATVFWIVVLLAVGFIGFFVAVLVIMGKVLGKTFRMIFGRRRPRSSNTGAGSWLPPRACENPACGYLNRGDARYCARCGAATGRDRDTTHHG